ncbi:MAG TPA: transposase [candidate division Zixibacteria bacterium]
MRKQSGGVWHIAEIIADDLEGRETGLSKPQRIGLADIAASVLSCRSVNTSELANILPRSVKSSEESYRYISRWLSNPKIKPIEVMKGFVPEILYALTSNNQTAILMLDQSKIGNGFECLMVSLRLGERAIPVAWRVKKTEGEMGYDEQEPLLKAVYDIIPKGIEVMLAADRFYGTAALISLCQRLGWKYRIRLKGNLNLFHQEGWVMNPHEAKKLDLKGLENVRLGEKGPLINVGILHESGHPEAWYIAMDDKPSEARTLDYGLRWGIEALFSDLKTRGFSVTKTQLKQVDRIERLLLVLTIALYWAVSTGMMPREAHVNSKKKRKDL